MAKLVQQMVSWQSPSDTSVVKHRLYYDLETETVDYNTSFIEIDMPTCEYDLSTLPVESNGGVYKLALTSIDGIGNESNMSSEKLIPLDNTPPTAPIWI